MREYSVPAVVDVSDDANLTDVVWENAETHPDGVQFSRRTADGWEPVTARRFRDDVVAAARGLVASGVEPGDRVALLSKTRYEWSVLDYAIWAAGAVTVPIYETSARDQVEWILSDSGAVACVVETATHHQVVSGLALPELRHTWVFDDGGMAALRTAGESVDAEQVEKRRRGRRADDLATLIYTSGTTGRPKGCMLTHRNMCSDIMNTVPGLANLFNEDSSTLLFLPLAHALARIIQIGVVQSRVHTALTADTTKLLADLAELRPTFLLSVPRVFEKVYNGARQKAHDEGKGAIFDRADATAVEYSRALSAGGAGAGLRLRHWVFDKLVYSRLRAAMGGRCFHAISGGGPLGERLAHFFRGIGVTIFEGYGLTECAPVVSLNLEHALKIGTIGRPIPGTTVRIAEDGELLVKAAYVFSGYWHNDAATADVFDEDGFFRTGDLAHLDDDGYLTITGRKKEIIVTAGGKNVAPAGLEDRVRAHPLISQCMVVGDRQPFIAALVTLDEEALPGWLERHGKPAETTVAELATDEDLRTEIQGAIDDANSTVSRAESIRVFRVLPRDFSEETGEMTPSLKVKRGVVMKEYADEITAIYT